MPRLDGTGPRGQGPKTGRGLGKCVTEVVEVDPNTQKVNTSNTGYGLGLGQGRKNRNNLKVNSNQNRGIN